MRTFWGLDGSQMFQMQMMVQQSRRTALGLAVGLWTDNMVCLCAWEKCTRLMFRPTIDKQQYVENGYLSNVITCMCSISRHPLKKRCPPKRKGSFVLRSKLPSLKDSMSVWDASFLKDVLSACSSSNRTTMTWIQSQHAVGIAVSHKNMDSFLK